jgi:hypothetical protein
MRLSSRLSLWAVAGLVALAVQGAQAATARSTHYEMEHVSVAASGGISQSSNYQVVNMIKTAGVANARATGGAYLIEPLTGSAPITQSAVADWQLY